MGQVHQVVLNNVRDPTGSMLASQQTIFYERCVDNRLRSLNVRRGRPLTGRSAKRRLQLKPRRVGGRAGTLSASCSILSSFVSQYFRLLLLDDSFVSSDPIKRRMPAPFLHTCFCRCARVHRFDQAQVCKRLEHAPQSSLLQRPVSPATHVSVWLRFPPFSWKPTAVPLNRPKMHAGTLYWTETFCNCYSKLWTSTCRVSRGEK
jgi:hypothetical protein